jgi:mitochondrial chaperone BCS1
MVFGGLAASLRSIPGKVSDWLFSRLTIVVTVQENDVLFSWVNFWLSTHDYAKKCRTLKANTRQSHGDSNDSPVAIGKGTKVEPPQVILAPSKGTHIIRYKGAFVIIHRGNEGNSSQPGNSGVLGSAMAGMFQKEEITFRFRTSNRQLVKDFFEDIRTLSNPPEELKTHVYINRWGSWAMMNELPSRNPESVILPGNQFQDIIDDVHAFYDNVEFYRRVGIPHRRGYMFSGVPGTGKSSLLRAVASSLGAALYVLNLADGDLTDSSLVQYLSDIDNARALVVIEDIDSYFNGRNPVKADQKITFSGLLNAIDGAAACEGRLLFVTTNHRDSIDPALIRPGRVDYEIVFTYADDDQIRRMFYRFHPTATVAEYAESLVALRKHFESQPITTAQLQGYLYTNYKNRA